jgi:aldose sugar dehydrogenase
MRKRERHISIFVIVLLLVALGIFLFKYQDLRDQITAQKQAQIPEADDEQYSWKIDEFARDLEVVWDIGFDAENNLYVTERPGRLRVLSPQGLQLANIPIPNVASVGESGLTGVTLDPKFSENRTIYLYYSYRESGNLNNRVSSFTYSDGALSNEKFILDALPGGAVHNGGRLRFGPDGKLYVLTGDAARPAYGQDMNSLAGKVLRLNSDGSVPSDNPTPGSLVYSRGHRNPQGIAWHPLTEEPLVTEHGETAHDEINLVKPGNNYGWPEEKKCFAGRKEFTDPILCSGTETYAPSGITALSTTIWKFRNSFIYSGLRGKVVERIEVIDGKLAKRDQIIKEDYGRMRAAAQAPDGTIYVSTSNRDNRGQVQAGDDKILKLTPELKK